jgi:tRNA pseudouridine38-40 synthase
VRIAILVEYDGTKLCGSQYQVGVRTVQAELESALAKFARSPVTAIFSGRTDSGVHAAGQVVHFDWPEEKVDLWRLAWALNGIMGDDISVAKIQIVEDKFHARYKAISRQYVYRILNRPQRSALLRDTHHFVPLTLDLEAMAKAAGDLLGEHDFIAFKSTNSDRVNSVCQVTRAELLILSEGVLEFWIAANHFVYNMVRIIVGTLLEIGLGKKSPESIRDALTGRKRDLAGPTAPAWGLCLNSVQYPEQYNLFASSSPKLVHSVHGPEI